MEDSVKVKPTGDAVTLEVYDGKVMRTITGFNDSDIGMELAISKLSNFHFQDESKKDKCVMLAMKSLKALEPKDGVEGMLSAQMLATHDLAMDLLKRAKAAKYMDAFEKYLNGATKLLRTFTTQTVALDGHRGNHGAKVEVKNVNVNEGGQAIVGNVTSNSK